jgi:hypothetical protein
MATLSFKLDQLFILMVPELVVLVNFVGAVIPSEPKVFQNSLSIKSKFVIVMKCPLMTNPQPQRLVLLVTTWHHTMAIGSFKLDQLFKALVPELVVGVAVAVSFPSEPDFVE